MSTAVMAVTKTPSCHPTSCEAQKHLHTRSSLNFALSWNSPWSALIKRSNCLPTSLSSCQRTFRAFKPSGNNCFATQPKARRLRVLRTKGEVLTSKCMEVVGQKCRSVVQRSFTIFEEGAVVDSPLIRDRTDNSVSWVVLGEDYIDTVTNSDNMDNISEYIFWLGLARFTVIG